MRLAAGHGVRTERAGHAPAPAPLIHIGYHKTGTTWLQEVALRPRLGFQPLMTHEEVWREILRPNDAAFRPGAVRALLAGRIRAAEASGLAPVISSELLCGHPFYGGHEGPGALLRLHAIAPEARILVSIREQIGALVSTYMQYLSRAGSLPARRFFAPGHPVPGYRAFDPSHFAYDERIAWAQSLFGAARVHVVTQEELAADPVALAARLAAIAGVPPPSAAALDAPRRGESPAEAVAGLLRRINHARSGPAKPETPLDLGPAAALAARAVGHLARLGPVKRRLARWRPVRAEAERLFAGQFGESNRRLQGLVGAVPDLAALGYDVAAPPATVPAPHQAMRAVPAPEPGGSEHLERL